MAGTSSSLRTVRDEAGTRTGPSPGAPSPLTHVPWRRRLPGRPRGTPAAPPSPVFAPGQAGGPAGVWRGGDGAAAGAEVLTTIAQSERTAEERTALRRVATLVARAAPSDE